MEFLIGQIICFKEETKTFKERLLWIDNEMAVLISIDKEYFPHFRLLTDIEGAIEVRQATLEIDSRIDPLLGSEIPERHKKTRDQSWDLIKDMVTKEPEIYDFKARNTMIRAKIEETGVSEKRIIRYLKKYWQCGYNNCLTPEYYKFGALGVQKKAGDKKRGRPKKNAENGNVGINIDDRIKLIFAKGLKKYYLKSNKLTLVRTYEMILKEYFNDGTTTNDGVEVPLLKSTNEIPTFGQFAYWYSKNFNLKNMIVSRYGAKHFLKGYRSIQGNAIDGITQPGVFEIDCQTTDVYLVSSTNRNKNIGRAALYVVIDKFSKVIVGIYVGLENGSYKGAALALYNAGSDKVEFCKQYGIEISPEDWPRALPTRIVADRGELEGSTINTFISNLGVSISTTASERPELKSTVEKNFDIFNQLINPHLPGVVDQNKKSQIYMLQARLTIEEYTKILIKAVLYYNKNQIVSTFSNDLQFLESGTKPVPIEIFNWGLKNRAGALRTVAPERLILALMPKSEATITGKGVKFKNQYYISKGMLKDETLILARAKSKKVSIVYDPRNMKSVYLRNEQDGSYERCDSTTPMVSRFLEEIEARIESTAERAEGFKVEALQEKVKLISEIENVVGEARKKYKAQESHGLSKKERIREITEVRKEEKSAEREKYAFRIGEEEQKKNDEVVYKQSSSDDVLALLLEGLEGDRDE